MNVPSQAPDHHERPHVHFTGPHQHPLATDQGLRLPPTAPHHDETCIFLAPTVVAVARGGVEHPAQREAPTVILLPAARPLLAAPGGISPQPHRDVGLPPPSDLVILWRTLRI